MAYDFEKDASAKSFEMKLDNETIMTAFITTDEEADGVLPELDTGVYGGIGYGPMGADWEPIGGGGSSDFSIAEMTVAGDDVALTLPIIDETDVDHPCVLVVNQTFEVGQTYKLPLYGAGLMILKDINLPLNACTVSGNAELTEATLLVTGDFTLTKS